MVAAQGGDAAVVEHPERLPRAPIRRDVLAADGGVVVGVEPRALGRAIIELGGGRRIASDRVLPDVGLEVPVKPGTRVGRGDLLAVVHARSEAAAGRAVAAVQQAITIGADVTESLPLIAWRVTAAGAAPYGGLP